MQEICNKICRKICKKYDKYAKKYDKYAMWTIYYGKYARKYANMRTMPKICKICTPHLAVVKLFRGPCQCQRLRSASSVTCGRRDWDIIMIIAAPPSAEAPA